MVEIDDEGVRNGDERVRWVDLVAVTIVTTDEGPWCEDLFWLLHAQDRSGCAVPGAAGGPLLHRLQALPRFDNDAVIRATLSTEHATFHCWSGEPGEGAVISEAASPAG